MGFGFRAAQAKAPSVAPSAASGGTPITGGPLTSGTVPIATGAQSLGDSTLVKSGTAYTLTGSLALTLGFTVNTNKFTVDSTTGNTLVAGTLTRASDDIFTDVAHLFRANTSDGADNAALSIMGGGAISHTRGASLTLYGNENAGAGSVELVAGSAAGTVIISTNNNVRFTINAAGLVSTTGALTSGDILTASKQLVVTRGVFLLSTVKKVADYTATSTDETILVDTAVPGTDVNITLPAAAGADGQVLNIKKVAGAFNVILLRSSADTIDGATSYTFGTLYQNVQLKADAANGSWWIR